MLAPHVRISGFDAMTWGRLLSLVTGRDPEHLDLRQRADQLGDAPSPARHGTLVVVEGADGQACAAFHSRRGAIPIAAFEGRERLAQLCDAHAARRAVCIGPDASELLWQRAAERLRHEDDYVTQWLALAAIARELIDEGQLALWPPPMRRLPLATMKVLQRALDLVLPEGQALSLVLWQGTELWTAVALRRTGPHIDWVAGPEHLLAWSGPLGGDWRRDHRVIARAVSRSLAPLHLGIYAQASVLQSLLREPDPGVWARAIAVRDLIIHPAPPYIGVAVGADAFRALAAHSSRWLRGLDLMSTLTPVARYARSRVDQVASITEILGFSPLEQLGRWLRDRSEPPR